MLRSGRINWLLAATAAVVLGIVAVFMSGGESARGAADRFMVALAKADVKTLADMSFYRPERPREQVEAEWKQTLEYGKYYRFIWQQRTEDRLGGDRARVGLAVVRNAADENAYEENFNIDLVKVDGKWKVDVASISRDMYPGLPR